MTIAHIPARPYFTDARIAKLIVAVNGLVPLALLLWDYGNDDLGASPSHFALLTTGLLSVIFLFLTLLVTPLRALTRWNTLIAARRLLGLYAFFYACIHVGIFFVNVADESLPNFLHEVRRRFYILIGITALILMVPLALTSTTGMIQRLGPARWKLLHKAIYFVAILAVIHYCIQSKVVSPQQYGFIIALFLLLGYRFVAQFLQLAPPKKIAQHASPLQTSPAKNKFWNGSLRISQITPESPNVRTFRLVPTLGTDLPFDYLPGQYLNLTLNINHQKITRSFTIASTPTRKGCLEISVKREPAGAATNHLHDSIHVGDLVQIAAPAGRLTFTGSEADAITLLAGGVGITPLISVIRYLTDIHWPGQIHLAYAAKTQSDLLFKNELDILAQKFPNLHLHYTLTQANPNTWHGHTGRLTADFLQQQIPTLKSSRIHICGPDPMLQSLRPALQSLGIPQSQIHSESFTRAANTMPESQTAELEPPAIDNPAITFTRSQKSANALPNESLLETAERCGIPIDFDCRSGICGTCKTKLLSGQVHMDTQDALTPQDRATSIILACQAKPLTNLTLDA